MKGFWFSFLASVIAPALLLASPFGARELSQKFCPSVLQMLVRPSFFTAEVRRIAVDVLSKTKQVVWGTEDFFTPTEIAERVVAANAALSLEPDFVQRIQLVIQRMAKINVDLDYVGIAKNHLHSSNADYIAGLNGIAEIFEHLFNYDQILDPAIATARIHEQSIPEFSDLLELQFLFKNEGYQFSFERQSVYSRSLGGPLFIDSRNHPIFRISPRIANEIPRFLIHAAVLWHWELLKLIEAKNSLGTNQMRIGTWILENARGLGASNHLNSKAYGFPSIFAILRRDIGILKPELRDALIENTLLRRLGRLYKKLRDVDGFDTQRTRLFDEWTMGDESQMDFEIAEMLGEDYQISNGLLDLRSPMAEVDLIIDDEGGITWNSIREKAFQRIRLPAGSKSLWTKVRAFFKN